MIRPRGGPAALLIAPIVAAAYAPVAALAQVPPANGREVMERYAAQDRTEDTQVRVSMTLVDAKGRERHRTLSMATRTDADGTRRTLVRFLEPADVEGTGFLSIDAPAGDDDAWLYLPSLRRVRRVAGTDKRDAFVGTDFTYEDLEPETLADHRYTLVRADSAGGTPVWVVTSVPAEEGRPGDSAYGRRELWIAQDHAVLLQARLYGSDGTYLRLLTADDVRPVPGSDKWRPYRLVMEDVRAGTRTELEMSEYRVDQGVDASLFTERYLKRGR